ncbi:gamma-glutamylcyclotransferase family protein [Sinorhizobium fredii]|uniref:gamma-glutamylcyclotransferase family protein n=1 Tax=Rhizobium fredii TaxID=380 RepID=UPI003513586D
MTFLYFAYGSNMLPARLKARCASARVIGPATAKGFRLDFSKRSTDGSGKATLIVHEGAAPGVLFEIAKSDLAPLDRAEGAGKGYDRVDGFRVVNAVTREPITATTYLASAPEADLKPFDWYLALVIAGAHHHALGDQHLAELRLIEWLNDDDFRRKSRIEALQALTAHGFDDHYVLLEDPLLGEN